MLTSLQTVENRFHEDLFRDAFADADSIIDTVGDAQRRATLVFDVLLTYLSVDDLTMPWESSAK